jgi:thioredoxin-related protein
MIKLLFVSLFSFFANDITSLSIGSTIPLANQKLLDVSGKEISIQNAIRENGVLVMFSCNTCPYVIRNQERTKQINQYALDNKIGVIVINSNEAQRSDADSYEAMKKYADEQQYAWHYVVDKNSEIANAFGATRTPEVFLFNKKGVLIYKGAIDDNPSDVGNVKRQHLKTAIDEMLGGKNISVTESKSVGCSIKRVG